MVPCPSLAVLGLTRVVPEVPVFDVPQSEGGQGVVFLEETSVVRQDTLALEVPGDLQEEEEELCDMADTSSFPLSSQAQHAHKSGVWMALVRRVH